MADVRFETQLSAPPALAFGSLGEVLRDIASQEGAWEGFALHVELSVTGLPDVGYIAIPIALEVDPVEPGLMQIGTRFRAAHHPESFPVFGGAFGIDASGPSSSILWIAGTYEVPHRGVGKLVDATLLRGVAHRALDNLVSDVSVACAAIIQKREAAYARYRMFAR